MCPASCKGVALHAGLRSRSGGAFSRCEASQNVVREMHKGSGVRARLGRRSRLAARHPGCLSVKPSSLARPLLWVAVHAGASVASRTLMPARTAVVSELCPCFVLDFVQRTSNRFRLSCNPGNTPHFLLFSAAILASRPCMLCWGQPRDSVGRDLGCDPRFTTSQAAQSITRRRVPGTLCTDSVVPNCLAWVSEEVCWLADLASTLN